MMQSQITSPGADTIAELSRWFVRRILAYVTIVASTGLLFVAGSAIYAFLLTEHPKKTTSFETNRSGPTFDQAHDLGLTKERPAGFTTKDGLDVRSAGQPITSQPVSRNDPEFRPIVTFSLREVDLVRVNAQRIEARLLIGNRGSRSVQIFAIPKHALFYTGGKVWAVSDLTGVNFCDEDLGCKSDAAKEARSVVIEPGASVPVSLGLVDQAGLPLPGEFMSLRIDMGVRVIPRANDPATPRWDVALFYEPKIAVREER